jgi:hypothetical protein
VVLCQFGLKCYFKGKSVEMVFGFVGEALSLLIPVLQCPVHCAKYKYGSILVSIGLIAGECQVQQSSSSILVVFYMGGRAVACHIIFKL